RLSRSGIHRCLKRHALAARLTPDKAPAAVFQTDAPAGFIHIDVKYLPPLGRRRSYAYVAIDRATRFVYLEILPDPRATTPAAFPTTRNATPTSIPSSPTTIVPACDVSITMHPPSSSLNSRDTTPSPGRRGEEPRTETSECI